MRILFCLVLALCSACAATPESDHGSASTPPLEHELGPGQRVQAVRLVSSDGREFLCGELRGDWPLLRSELALSVESRDAEGQLLWQSTVQAEPCAAVHAPRQQRDAVAQFSIELPAHTRGTALRLLLR